jgi:NAD dependent epimerase/dehydratase
MNLKGRRVLVTGAEGFIGSHLVEALLAAGCSVRAMVLYNSFGSWGWLESLSKQDIKKVDIVMGDVRDPGSVKNATKDMDLIFHLAALIGIPYSYNSPDSYIDTNVKGTLNMLQASRENNVKRLLITSTSEVYGTAKKVPISETHPLQGQSPYSATKIAADKIAESFYRSFGLPVTTVRPFNTYGPRQSARAIIPTVITQLLNNKSIIRLGSVEPTRDFNFVKDVCAGFLEIAKSTETVGEEINIATNKEISIGDVTNAIIKRINPKAEIILDKKRIRPEKSEVSRLIGDNKKIKRLTSWKPSYSLAKGLDITIEWFKQKQNLQNYKADIYNV